MSGNGDSLQPVKYLGKVRSLYAHGLGVAVVSISYARSRLDDTPTLALSRWPRNPCVPSGLARRKARGTIAVPSRSIRSACLSTKRSPMARTRTSGRTRSKTSPTVLPSRCIAVSSPGSLVRRATTNSNVTFFYVRRANALVALPIF